MAFILLFLLFFNFAAPVTAEEVITESGFRFTELGWSDDPDADYLEYEPNQGVFKKGTRAYAYFEVAGFSTLPQDEKYLTHLAVDVHLKTSGGFRLFTQRDVVDFDSLDWQPRESVWFYLYVDIPWFAPRATYIAEVVVRDLISGKEIRHQEKLTVE